MNFNIILVVVLSACSIAYICFTWPTNEIRRILSTDDCDRPVEQCPEGEEAYFRTYPDVATKKRKPRSAYLHWKRYGKAEGKHYICGHKKFERIGSDSKMQKDHGFVVVAVFKNEAMVFSEWISHYLWQGASHFFLIDNGSTDDWKSTIPPEVHARITVTREKGNHIQRKSYNSLLPMLREKHPRDWALIVDLDEYLYAKAPQTIASYLSTLSDDVGQVVIPW